MSQSLSALLTELDSILEGLLVKDLHAICKEMGLSYSGLLKAALKLKIRARFSVRAHGAQTPCHMWSC